MQTVQGLIVQQKQLFIQHQNNFVMTWLSASYRRRNECCLRVAGALTSQLKALACTIHLVQSFANATIAHGFNTTIAYKTTSEATTHKTPLHALIYNCPTAKCYLSSASLWVIFGTLPHMMSMSTTSTPERTAPISTPTPSTQRTRDHSGNHTAYSP